VDALVQAGVDCAPTAIGKEGLKLGDFVKQPEQFAAFLQGLRAPTTPPPN
jgi:hypothetical protein